MDVTESKFTSDGCSVNFGGHAFVTNSWEGKKQTAVSLDTVPRIEG